MSCLVGWNSLGFMPGDINWQGHLLVDWQIFLHFGRLSLIRVRWIFLGRGCWVGVTVTAFRLPIFRRCCALRWNIRARLISSLPVSPRNHASTKTHSTSLIQSSRLVLEDARSIYWFYSVLQQEAKKKVVYTIP